MPMFIWQEPGTDSPAHWLWLGADPLWHVKGGTWYKSWGGGYFVLTVEPVEAAFEGRVRWLRVDKLTMPERRRILGDRPEVELLAAATAQGLGWPVGVIEDHSAAAARVVARKLAEDFEAAGVKPTTDAPKVHHRRWEELRLQDPVAYSTGFFIGMQKGDVTSDDVNEVLLAGWEHGWEYAVGRTPMPAWYASRKSDVDGAAN